MKTIIDTGPWIALIDKSETMHTPCVEWFRTYKGRLYSTEAVFTEVLYLLNFSFKAQSAAFEFVLQSIITLVPADLKSVEKTKLLMKKYSDLPMDYADATIVYLASEAGIPNIFTLDRRDFSVYRMDDNKGFTLFPGL
jgi:uncharacterized protein